ncbi:CPBP family intramembrane glutamic endopeptidase [Sphingomicrobium sediminis]|uniref:CPBP family intramembrane metalloprotease n=1 Tax=Sphingomicrobium sediminis TaxID=2950949 RepID=A0A9X2EES6_9SPHN|nr:CPBP family intramembrane glutamic endopeptidase [Sphingomicrobium sediminis]MCM8556265.1 CPBP family intramembrane metalloprotease [Sphingomicrobium sediminis]
MFADLFPLYFMLAFSVAMLTLGTWRERVHLRRLREQGPDYRMRIYRDFLVTIWPAALLGIAVWLASGRDLAAIGFSLGEGLGAGIAWGAALGGASYNFYLARGVRVSQEMRDAIAAQLMRGGALELLDPADARQANRFQAVAVTAGITEEILFRGLLIGSLALVMPIWAAGVIGLAIFILAHAYQGARGMLSIVPISTILTLMFVLSDSIMPGIILHIAVDMAAGVMLWNTTRERAALAANPA